jgi:hypothetical protein
LLLCSSYLALGVSNWLVIIIIIIMNYTPAISVTKRRPLPCFPLLNGNYNDKVIPLSLSNLASLLCMVAADGDLLCDLAKFKELVRDSIIKSYYENFLKW